MAWPPLLVSEGNFALNSQVSIIIRRALELEPELEGKNEVTKEPASS